MYRFHHYLFASFFIILSFYQCSEKQKCVPDDTTQSLIGENITLAESLADNWIANHPPETIAWNWEPAVLMFALTKLYNAAGDRRYFEYYRQWIDYHIDKGFFLMMSDHVIPSAVAGDLLRRTCEEKYKTVIDNIYTYLTEEAPRTPEGGISHLGTLAPASPQLWIDSLFMFGMPMLNAFRATGNKKYVDLIEEQITIFAGILQDSETGFFRHAWINQQLVPQEPVFWARGNGWVLVVLTELLSVLREQNIDTESIEKIYLPLLKSVVSVQDSNTSLWWTVLNRPGETYLETSASALFVYGIAKGVNGGIIDPGLYSGVVLKGITGIKNKIMFNNGIPEVTDISKGTQPGDFENYKNVPLGNDIPYGIGAVILALIESDQ